MSNLIARHGSPVCQTQFDQSGTQRASSAVIDALAAVADTSPLEMEPLCETIELEALDRLIGHAGTAGAGIALEFRVDEWDLIVTGDGRVIVFDSEDDDDFDLELA
ncbi:HalOD1 output domain-containing protein [Natrinema marinum]|uniref:HalOD1 output domain-containing protein n=1 Tax=Natrinema marinum TaxID=2961598 RepID=UPI0020C8670C|nr:HalOD1 output domain-containing protein [Natrinema marinum]